MSVFFNLGMAVEIFYTIYAQYVTSTNSIKDMDLSSRSCLRYDEDMSLYPEINLKSFSKYSQKSCILECTAQEMYNECGCLPYHYSEFRQILKNDTYCDYKGLKCLSKMKG